VNTLGKIGSLQYYTLDEFSKVIIIGEIFEKFWKDFW